MPLWERFRNLCQLCFGPLTQVTWLAELARLPFHSSDQDYSDRFNAVLCHARDLNPLQKAELFVGGLNGRQAARDIKLVKLLQETPTSLTWFQICIARFSCYLVLYFYSKCIGMLCKALF